MMLLLGGGGQSECLQFQVGCGVLRPFACTEGDAHGGCAETEVRPSTTILIGCSACNGCYIDVSLTSNPRIPLLLLVA